MSLIVSISGVRGIIGQSLTDAVVLDFASAFASYIKKGTVVVGRDTRATGERIKGLFIEKLREFGINVIYIGIAPTPTVQLMVKHLKAAGGIVITASHNPIQWNGIKFIRNDGIFLNEGQATRLIHIYNTKKFAKKAKKGSLRRLKDPYKAHINKVLKNIDVASIKKKRFKVVLDSCNGAGSLITVQLLKKLGCSVIELNTDTNKPFPHNPEPIPVNLTQLCEKVKAVNADIGMAQDADADRLALVTDKAIAPGEEYTLAIAVENILSQAKGKKIVVTNMSTSMMSDVIARKYNAKIIKTKIGEVNVAEKMKAVKGLIGGEGNGGVMFPKIGYNRDSLAGIGLVLSEMARTGKTISQLISSLPEYHIVKSKIECGSPEQVTSMIKKIKDKFRNEKMDLTDGVKILYPNAWVHVRPSNTEPIIRVIAEAKNLRTAEFLSNEVLNF